MAKPTILSPRSHYVRIRYLMALTVLLLLWSYLALLGGTLNGLVDTRFQLANNAVFGIGGLLWLLWRTRRRHAGTSLDAPLMALVGAGILATVFSTHPRLSLEAVMWLFLAVLWFYVWIDLLRAGLDLSLLNKVLVIVAGLVALFGIVQLTNWYTGWLRILPNGWVPAGTVRVTSLMGPPNYLVDYFVLLLPWGLTRAFQCRGWRRWLLLGWALVLLVLVVFTSSRGGWVGAAVALISWALMWGWQKRERLRTLWGNVRLYKGAAALIGGLVFILLGAALITMLWVAKDPTHPSGWSNLWRSRDYIWAVAWEMWRAHPWTGSGPGTFGLAYIRTRSIPPEVLLYHAHNLYLHVSAVMGLAGVLAMGWIGSTILRRVWQLWASRHQPSTPLVAIFPALLGMATHALFEVSVVIPIISFTVMTYLAILFSGETLSHIEKRGWQTGWLWVMFVAVVGFALWNTPKLTRYVGGLQQTVVGNWEQASHLLEEVATSDPSLALYWQQAAFAHGMLALHPDGSLRNAEEAKQALALYQRALTLEPGYAVPWANQGVLFWALGDQENAVKCLRAAVERAPRQHRFWATLGVWYEVMGKEAEAEAAHRQALELQPAWREAPFFTTGSRLRQRVVAQMPALANPLAPGWEALSQGRAEEAEAVFAQKVGLNQGEAYLGLGMAYTAQGKWSSAKQALEIAKRIGVNSWLKVRLALALGDLAYGQSNYLQAVNHYQEAFQQAVLFTSSEGYDRSQDYAWFVYHRLTLRQDLLPGLAPVFPEEFLAAMERLAASYQRIGDRVPATLIRFWVQQQR